MFTPQGDHSILGMLFVGFAVTYVLAVLVAGFKFLRYCRWNFKLWEKNHFALEAKNETNTIVFLLLVGLPLFFFFEPLLAYTTYLVKSLIS